MKRYSLFLATAFSLPLLAEHCLGPENYGVNPPVRPYTCNGDFEFTASALYWKATQDGMEYAIKSNQFDSSSTGDLFALVDSDYLNPHFDWNFGFQLGLGYHSACDGWDFKFMWTRYHGKSFTHEEADFNNTTGSGSDIINLLVSNFREFEAFPIFVHRVDTSWNMKLNLFDLDLGRMYWNSRRLSLRPHVGLRLAYIDQSYQIDSDGGVFAVFAPLSPAVSDHICFDNNSKGFGPRIGLDTLWNLGCGFSIYGDFALSILSSRFHIDQDEVTRDVNSPFSKNKILEVKDTFRISTLASDLSLGLQYQTLLADCDYVFAVSLGWDHHLFLNQNQMWRIIAQGGAVTEFNNFYHQRRGDLSTQGWTLKIIFDF